MVAASRLDLRAQNHILHAARRLPASRGSAGADTEIKVRHTIRLARRLVSD
jgi:hypothetical protein